MFKRTALSVLFVSSLYAVGCGGSDASAESAKEKLQNPTGTFTKDNASVALTDRNSQQSSTKNTPSLFGGGVSGASYADGGLRALATRFERQGGYKWLPAATALRIMGEDGLSSGGIKCDTSSLTGGDTSGSFDCTCNDGGTISMDYDIADGEYQIDAKYDACKIGNVTMNVDFGMLMTKSEIIKIKKAPAGAATTGISGGMNMLFNMVGTVNVDGKDNTIDAALVSQGAYVFLSVKVNDGFVTFGASGDTFIIQVRGGKEIQCTKGKCVDEDGKEFDISAEIAEANSK